MLPRLTLVVSIALARSARADEAGPLPCRPTIACTAQIEAPGWLVLEAGYLRKDLDGGRQHSVPFLFKLSLDDRVQLQLGSNGPTFSGAPISQQFQDDLTLGAKLRLFASSETTLSVSAAASVPIPANQKGYLRTYDLLLAALLSRELPLGLTADFNLGLDLWRLEGTPLLQPWAALSLNHPLSSGLTGSVEVYRFTPALPAATRDAGVLFALAWRLSDRLVLDAGGDLGLLRERGSSIFAGFTLAIVKGAQVDRSE